jgi:hypothetical protein
MRSLNLQLTVSGDRFSITPLPPQVDSHCPSGEHCQKRASHRLLWSDSTAAVELLCDTHALVWTHDHGLLITTARLGDSVA